MRVKTRLRKSVRFLLLVDQLFIILSTGQMTNIKRKLQKVKTNQKDQKLDISWRLKQEMPTAQIPRAH